MKLDVYVVTQLENLTSHLITETPNIRISKTIWRFSCGCEKWFLTLKEEYKS